MGAPGALNGYTQAAFLRALGSAWRGLPCARLSGWGPWAGGCPQAMCVFPHSQALRDGMRVANRRGCNSLSRASFPAWPF